MTKSVENYMHQIFKKLELKENIKPFKNSSFVGGYAIEIAYTKFNCSIKAKKLVKNQLESVNDKELESVCKKYCEIVNNLFGVGK